MDMILHVQESLSAHKLFAWHESCGETMSAARQPQLRLRCLSACPSPTAATRSSCFPSTRVGRAQGTGGQRPSLGLSLVPRRARSPKRLELLRWWSVVSHRSWKSVTAARVFFCHPSLHVGHPRAWMWIHPSGKGGDGIPRSWQQPQWDCSDCGGGRTGLAIAAQSPAALRYQHSLPAQPPWLQGFGCGFSTCAAGEKQFRKVGRTG